jgi:hypothetical protein
MGIKEFFEAPLQGKMTVSRVFWLYGIVGSLVYGLFEFLIDPGNVFLMRLYSIGGLLYTVYVIVATHRSAVNCKTQRMASFVRISCVASLVLLPFIAYLELSGALSTDIAGLDQLDLTGR